MDERMTTLADISEAAGAAIMAVRGSGRLDVMMKADDSPVTAADLASHKLIGRLLAERFPGVPVLSEESAAAPYAERAGWQRLFIVDPLDGTKEFVKELGEFCVCIALAEGGFPSLGAVYVPAWHKTYVGGLGLGAFRRKADGPWMPISARRPPQDGLVALSSRSHPSPENDAFLAKFNIRKCINAGSALKFCLVAEGAADLYPRLNRGTHEWDTAAGQAVVEGAGGSVSVLVNGEPAGRLPVNKEDLFNPPYLARGLA